MCACVPKWAIYKSIYVRCGTYGGVWQRRLRRGREGGRRRVVVGEGRRRRRRPLAGEGEGALPGEARRRRGEGSVPGRRRGRRRRGIALEDGGGRRGGDLLPVDDRGGEPLPGVAGAATHLLLAFVALDLLVELTAIVFDALAVRRAADTGLFLRTHAAVLFSLPAPLALPTPVHAALRYINKTGKKVVAVMTR